MKKISTFFIILSLFIGCSHKHFERSIEPKSQTSKIRKDALVVGVGEYKNNIETLFGVEKDLKKIRKLLNYFHVNRITTLEDSKATLRSVKREFYNYINSKRNAKGNIFIFYYSGHGVQVDDENQDEPDTKDEATALYDFEINSQKVITKGVLVDDELSTLLAQIKSKKILIFDKCHSGSSHRASNPFVKSINGEYKLSPKILKNIKKNKRAKKEKHLIVFSATKDNQKAEDSPIGGLFTNSFVDGILNKTADANRDKKITLLELKQFCKRNIHLLANRINKKEKLELKGNATPLFISSIGLDRSIDSIFNLP